MEHYEVSAQHMEAIKALAETNMKISEAKNALALIKKEEVSYLEQREKEATERVSRILGESNELVKQTKGNYEDIKQFLNTVSSLALSVVESQETLELLIASFNEKSRLWEAETKKQEEEIEEIKKHMVADKAYIQAEHKNIQKQHEKIRNEQKKLDADRGTLERAIKRLKEGRI